MVLSFCPCNINGHENSPGGVIFITLYQIITMSNVHYYEIFVKKMMDFGIFSILAYAMVIKKQRTRWLRADAPQPAGQMGQMVHLNN